MIASTTGANNVAIGSAALSSNITASNNTAVGYQAGYSNTTGTNLAFVGRQAGYTNSTGSGNAALGVYALYTNSTGNSNTAVGSNDTNYLGALQSNTTGSSNTAVGTGSLGNNTTASNNTAVGYQAGYSNVTGVQNTFIGQQSGYNTNNATGYNTFVGRTSGYSNTTGYQNTFVGGDSGYYVTTGNKNTILGMYTGNQGGLDIRTASNYIVLSDGDGNPRAYWDATGRAIIPTIYSETTAGAANVNVASSGLLQRSTSSLKYKTDVLDAKHGLAEVLALRSVTYKGVNDGELVFGGLIAEEVDAAGLTEFVVYAEDGSPDALAYGNIVSLCIKAIQELNAKVEAQALEIATLKGK
jgi:hypothetical protein